MKYLLSKNPIRPFTQYEYISAKSIFSSRIFLLGLAIRVAIVVCKPSSIQKELFIPFITSHIAPSIDPWSSYLSSNNQLIDAFPYGFITYIWYKSFIIVGGLIGQILSFWNTEDILYYGFNFGTLVLDTLTLVSINILVPLSSRSSKKIIFLYWLSPISLYGLYLHGQIDILPISLLLLSLIFLRFWRFALSGALIAAAISCKFSIIICLPFYYVFLKKNQIYYRKLINIYSGFGISITAFFISFTLLSDGFNKMVLGTPISLKVFDLNIIQQFGLIDAKFYIIPFAYLLCVYYFCQLERVNWSLFLCFSSLWLYALAVFVFPSPGWFVWVVPFAVIYIISVEGLSSKLFWLSSISYLIYFIYSYGFGSNISIPANMFNHNILYTLMQSLMILQMIDLYRNGIKSNNFYKNIPTPFLMIISGNNTALNSSFIADLGYLLTASKPLALDINEYLKFNSQTFSPNKECLPKLFEKDNIYSYHFSRYLKDIYRAKNSLSPSSIELESRLSFAHSSNLRRVKFISSQVPLSFTSNDLLSNISDFTVIITSNKYMSQEVVDSTAKSYADIIFWVESLDSSSAISSNKKEYVKLKAQLKNFYYQDFVQKQLLSTCGLNVEINYTEGIDSVEMNFEGDCSKDDLILVLKNSVSYAEDLISDIDALRSGCDGLMQLLVTMSLASRYSLSNPQNIT